MKFLFLSLSLLSIINLIAQDTTHLKEVEVFGIRASSKMPVTKTDVLQNDIKKNYFGNDAPTVLKNTSNVIFYSDGANYSGYMYYRVRGIDQTRINATLDGIPLNEPEDQGAYFSNYTDFLSNINSFQIQRGIGISSNGVSSYAGSLNFESVNLLDSGYKSLDVSLASFNTKRFSFALKTPLKNNLAFYLRASKVNSDGYRDHSGTDAATYFFSGVWYKKKQQLKLISFIGTSKNEMAYLPSDEDVLKINRRDNPLTTDERDNFYQNFNSLQYINKVSKNVTFLASGYYNKLIGNYDVLFSPVLQNFQLNSNFYGLLFTSNYKIDHFNIVLGTHMNWYNRIHSSSIRPDMTNFLYKNIGYKDEQSSYLKILYDKNKWNFYSDLQLRNTSFIYKRNQEYAVSIPQQTWSFFNYRFGINYQIRSAQSIFLFVGQSLREPTRSDMFAGYDDVDSINYNEVVNLNNIKPEQVTDIEIGYSYMDKTTSFKINLFDMQFHNEIAAIGQLSYIGLPLRKNVDKSHRMGIELEGSKKISNFKVSFNSAVNYSQIDKYITDYDLKSYSKVTPLLTPKFILNTSGEYYYKTKATAGISGRYISKSYLDNENQFLMSDFFETNCFINLMVEKRVSLTLGVNNLLNKNNYNSGMVMNSRRAYFVAPERNYFMNMSVKF